MGLEAMMQVMEYYHQERLLLLKCLQFVLLQGLTDPLMADVTAKLVADGLEDRTAAALRANVASTAPPTHGLAGSSAAGAAGALHGGAPSALVIRVAAAVQELGPGAAGAGVVPSSLHATLRDQALAERCELQTSLLLLYELLGVRCGGSRLLELLELTARGANPAAAAAAGAVALAAAGAPGSGVSTGGREATAAMSDHLGCLLVLSALDLPSHLTLIAGGSLSGGGAAGGAGGAEALPLGGKVKDVHDRVLELAAGPSVSPAHVALLLTWSALVRLLEPWLEGVVTLGENAADELVAKAAQAGFFDAISAMLLLQKATVSTPFAQLYRTVLLKSLSAIATAFELGPTRQDRTAFESLLKLLALIMDADPTLCAAVWDDSEEVVEPIRAIIRDAAAVFPAVMGPYLRLLTATCRGPAAAAAAYAHLQTAPRLVALHPADDPSLVGARSGGVRLAAPAGARWSQAPSVPTMTLPGGIDGSLLPLPGVLGHLDPDRWLVVCWDVGGTHRSFGQLLLLGRLVHAVHAVGQQAGAGQEAELVQDAQDALALISALVQQQPLLVPDLMTLSVDLQQAQYAQQQMVKHTWLTATAAAAGLMTQLLAASSAAAGPLAPGALLACIADCIRLLSALSAHHPSTALSALRPLLGDGALGAPALLLPGRGGAAAGGALLPLSQLPGVDVPGQVLLGLLPGLSGLQKQAEGPRGAYPVTSALLDLLASYLERGFARQEGLQACVLYCLYELLPGHVQWSYGSGEERWGLTGRLLKVLRLAIEAGARVMPAKEASGANSGSNSSSRPVLHITPLAAHVLHQLLFHGPALLSGCLPPAAAAMEAARRAAPASGELAAAEGAAGALLALLPPLLAAGAHYAQELPLEEWLLHGTTPSGEPPAAHMAAYITYNRPMVEPQQQQQRGAAGGKALAAAAADGGADGADGDAGAAGGEEEEQQLTYLALKAIQALQVSVSRPVPRAAGPAYMSAAVPRGSPTEDALKAFFRPDVARCCPRHFLLAVEVMEVAVVEGQAALIDSLLLPTGLDPVELEAARAAVAAMKQGPKALPAPAPAPAPAAATSDAKPEQPSGKRPSIAGDKDKDKAPAAAAGAAAAAGDAAGAGSKRAAGGSASGGAASAAPLIWSALDGLSELIGQAAALRSEQPQVLCATLRALCCVWQNQAAVQRPVALLRAAAAGPIGGGDAGDGGKPAVPLWSALEACITGGAPAGQWAPSEDPWFQLSEAYAWQILMLEAFAFARPSGSSAAAPGASGSSSHPLWAVVDKLVQNGVVAKAVSAYASGLELPLPTLQRLQAALGAVYLELGASGALGRGVLEVPGAAAGGAADAAAGGEELLSVAQELQQELSPVSQLVHNGSATPGDLEAVHSKLMAELEGSPGGDGEMLEDDLDEEGGSDGGLGRSPGGASSSPYGGEISALSPVWYTPAAGRIGGSGGAFGAGGAAFRRRAVLRALSAPPLGAVLLSAAQPPHSLTMRSAVYGAGYLLDGGRVGLLLGGATLGTIAAGDALMQTMASVSVAASLTSARVAALQAASALAALLLRDAALAPQLLPKQPAAPAAGTAADSSSMLAAAAAATAACVGQLARAQRHAASELLHAPACGMELLPRLLLDAALCAAKLTVHTLHALREQQQQAAAGSAAAAAAAAAGAPSTPVHGRPPLPQPPRSPGAQAATPSRAGAAGSAAAAAALLPCCLQLVPLLSAWLRLAVSGAGAGGLDGPVQQVAGSLTSAVLVALQLLTHGSGSTRAAGADDAAAADRQVLAALLLDLLPLLCRSSRDNVLPAGLCMQLLQEIVSRHLPAADWLPVLQQQLDLPALLAQSAARVAQAGAQEAAQVAAGGAETGSASDLGTLQLVVAVAQDPAGALWLHGAGVMEAATALGRQLLAAEASGALAAASRGLMVTPMVREYAAAAATGGRGAGAPKLLRPLTVAAASAAAQQQLQLYRFGAAGGVAAAAGPDTAGAYEASGAGGALVWSPAHRQWCVLLSFVAVLLRTLGQHVEVEGAAMDFLAAAEQRLLLACLPPAADGSQPLTLGGLQELERALFVLSMCARHMGAWHAALPGSLSAFRTAISSFIAFVAAPTLAAAAAASTSSSSTRPFNVDCGPLDAQEKQLAAAPTAVPAVEGWYRACALGGGGIVETTTTSAAAAAGGAPPATPGGGDAAAGGSAAATPMCSAYAARMADSVYTCCHHALSFILATSPQVCEAEAGQLGPTWPKPRELAALREQALAVVYSAYTPAAGAATADPRRKRACEVAMRVLTLLAAFPEGIALPPMAAAPAAGAAAASAAAGSLARSLQRAGGAAGTPLGVTGVSVLSPGASPSALFMHSQFSASGSLSMSMSLGSTTAAGAAGGEAGAGGMEGAAAGPLRLQEVLDRMHAAMGRGEALPSFVTTVGSVSTAAATPTHGPASLAGGPTSSASTSVAGGSFTSSMGGMMGAGMVLSPLGGGGRRASSPSPATPFF